MHRLTDWKIFCAARKAGKTAQDLGFKSSTAEVNRFASRYRVAKAFRGVELEGFGQKTQEGYNALFKLFLAYSAFEQFMTVRGWQMEQMKNLFDQYHAEEILCQNIRKWDKNYVFYSFVESQLDREAAIKEIKKFKEAKQALNSAYLASTVRHIFAHGQLTPHANRAQPKAVNQICNAIADFLLNIVDAEFSKQVKSLHVES